MGKDFTAAGGNGKGSGGGPLMRKDHYKSLGVNKAATAAGNGKGAGSIPLTGMDHYEILDVSKAAIAGGGDGKRARGVGGAKGPAGAVAVPGGAKGTGGRGWGCASTFSPADLKTAVKVTNEFYYEEEHRASFEDDGETFSSTHRSTIKTGVKVTNEYYYEEENSGLSLCKEEGKDILDDDEILADEDNDGAEMGDDGSGGGGYGDYYKDAGVAEDDAVIRDVDDYLNGDNYYYDGAAAGFDDGYNDYDGVDGPDDWW